MCFLETERTNLVDTSEPLVIDDRCPLDTISHQIYCDVTLIEAIPCNLTHLPAGAPRRAAQGRARGGNREWKRRGPGRERCGAIRRSALHPYRREGGRFFAPIPVISSGPQTSKKFRQGDSSRFVNDLCVDAFAAEFSRKGDHSHARARGVGFRVANQPRRNADQPGSSPWLELLSLSDCPCNRRGSPSAVLQALARQGRETVRTVTPEWPEAARL